MESILNSIKKNLGIEPEYKQFDHDIITYINGVFMTLTQLGVGPEEGFYITDESETWMDFTEDINQMKAIETLTWMKVKLIFDPPLSSALIESLNNQIKELEWRVKERAEELKQLNTND